jgi:hypothetical protein
MRTKPVGKVRAEMSVAIAGLLERSPGEPPAITMSNPAPIEIFFDASVFIHEVVRD